MIAILRSSSWLSSGLAAATVGSMAPGQPWSSSDGQIKMLIPAAAEVTASQEPLGSLMSRGWRLVWNSDADGPGVTAARVTLPVIPASGGGQAIEVLQIGWSSAPAAIASCLSLGLRGSNMRHLPARTINGVRYAATANSDSGMSQNIDAVDLRAVVRGRCYAVERFSYGVAAADRDANISLPQTRGAAMLDAAVASLHLDAGRTLAPTAASTSAGALVRKAARR